MEAMPLKDPQKLPGKEVLESVLKNSYSLYDELIKIISGPEYNLVPEWHYYNDGKAWLCKVCFKKKTVFWLSVWEGYFKTSFYFTEKHLQGIAELDIAESIKDDFSRSKPVGKLLPLVTDMKSKTQINDLLTIINFKKSLK